MRLATVRTAHGTRAAQVDGESLRLLDAADVGEVLQRGGTQHVTAIGEEIALADADLAPLVTRPAKVICIGLNYLTHLAELGRPRPEYPTLFAKFASTLIGARDDLVLPATSSQVDWEVELTAVIGSPIHRADEAQASAAIAGYTVANDVSMRDWQNRTKEWLQGKAFDASTPVGPVFVSVDEIDHARNLEVRCEVDGQTVQTGNTADLLFSPAAIVSYISQFASLAPGDLVLTGTPAGVGHVSGRHLLPGQLLRTSIEGIGECLNLTVADKT